MTLSDLIASKSTAEIARDLRTDRITAWRLRTGKRSIGRRELALGALVWPTEWDVTETVRALGEEMMAELDRADAEASQDGGGISR